MIYLIGGAPRVGKSIVADKVRTATQAKLVSTDDLCSAYTKTLSDEDRRNKFPLPGFSGDPSENTLTADERVDLQTTSAKSLWPEISKMIIAAVENGQDLVIEGVHILPGFVRELMNQCGSEKITALFLGLDDADQVVDGIMKNTSPDNWMRESDPAVIRQVAEFVAALSRRIEKEARAHGLYYKERSQDFEGDVRLFTERALNRGDEPLTLK